MLIISACSIMHMHAICALHMMHVPVQCPRACCVHQGYPGSNRFQPHMTSMCTSKDPQFDRYSRHCRAETCSPRLNTGSGVDIAEIAVRPRAQLLMGGFTSLSHFLRLLFHLLEKVHPGHFHHEGRLQLFLLTLRAFLQAPGSFSLW